MLVCQTACFLLPSAVLSDGLRHSSSLRRGSHQNMQRVERKYLDVTPLHPDGGPIPLVCKLIRPAVVRLVDATSRMTIDE
jgi:hypothetical protein